MKSGFSMNDGIVNWPELKTHRNRSSSHAAHAQPTPEQGRDAGVLKLIATNLERFKEQVIKTISRL
jgi:hypothetical protein